MKPEELSTIGSLLVLFGISWIAYAASLPIPAYPTCNNSPSNIPAPLCGSPGPQAQMFYALGVLSLIISALPLYVRVRVGIKGTTLTPVEVGDQTPQNFLKRCARCGMQLPLAAEKCYSCGARV